MTDRDMRERESAPEAARLYDSCDYYDAESLLTGAERRVLSRLRTFLDERARPVLAEYWERGEFPPEIGRALIELDLMEPAELTADGPARDIYHGFRIFELARTEASLATYYTAQAGLFRTAVNVGASTEQQAAWNPRVIDFSLRGVFCLTEPDQGSDIAGGNGITLAADVGRFHVDAEAVDSHEGTHEINSLIVGRAITGSGAFV